MYKNNSRNSSKSNSCSPLQLSCNLTGKRHAIGYYSYTNRCAKFKDRKYMRQILLILSILIFNTGFGQVDNFDILTKNIESSNVKSITKYRESKKFPNGQKKFKIEFNKNKKLVAIEEYKFPMGPDNPIVMRQDIRYDSIGRKCATYMKAPDGSIAIDTLIYNANGECINKQRFVNGKIVKTWDYSEKKKKNENKVSDDNGLLLTHIKSDSDSTTYKYDTNGNLIQELQFEDGKEHTKYTFQYDNNGRLINMETYLLYIGDGTNDPLKYYFEYEEFQ